MISFDADRWKAVQENYDAWWAGTSPRPLAGAAVRREDAPRLPPPITQANCTDWGKSPRELVDAIDAYLSTFDYWGDAYPVYSMDCFGPGVAAAMLGAKVDNATGRVWFLPGEQKEISELHFEFDPHNRWFLRLRELYLTAAAHFRGNALLSIPALKAVQWVPGAGKPDCDAYPEIYRKITAAGKLAQVNSGSLEVFERVVEGSERPGAFHRQLLFAEADSKQELLSALRRLRVL